MIAHSQKNFIDLDESGSSNDDQHSDHSLNDHGTPKKDSERQNDNECPDS